MNYISKDVGKITLFPNKVRFTGTRTFVYLLGDIIQSTISVIVRRCQKSYQNPQVGLELTPTTMVIFLKSGEDSRIQMGREAVVRIGEALATVQIGTRQLRTLIWHQNSSEIWLSQSIHLITCSLVGFLYARSRVGSKAGRIYLIMGSGSVK